MPLRLGSCDQFARVEESLRAAGFNEAGVCRALKVAEIGDLSRGIPKSIDLSNASPRLALFIRLFMFLESLPRAEVEQGLDQATLNSFLALDLVRPEGDDAEHYCSPIFLYPVAGLLIASDHYKSRDGSAFRPPPDAVLPAIYAGTIRFLRVISRSPAEEVLDLCAGSGVGALMLSRHVKRAVATDITPRAAHFAAFNRMLNRCHNVEIARGDLYDPVAGRTFDRIVAHPPYVPSVRGDLIYRDAGETGEVLVHRTIEGLIQHLRPGGTFYCVTRGLDTKARPFEERARLWLGPSHHEFDVIFAYDSEISPREVIRNIAEKDGSLEPPDIIRLERTFDEMEATRMVYGALVIHRHAGRSEPWTARTRLSQITDGPGFEWAFRWRRWSTRPGAVEALKRLRPRLSPHLRLVVTHEVQESVLKPTSFTCESDWPFRTTTVVDYGAMSVIAGFNGERTIAEVHQSLRENGALSEAVAVDDFAGAVAMFIERGLLAVDDSIFDDLEDAR
jgi:methylase of polypeptide subunit release factors